MAVAVVAVVLVVGAIVLANRGGNDQAGDPGPSSSTTPTTAPGDTGATGPGQSESDGETTTPANTDEAAAEAAVRSYFQGVIDQDCPAIVAASTETVWAPTAAANPEDAVQACQQAVAAGQLDYENYSLDGLEVIGNDGSTIRFTAYEMLDGTGYTETIFVSQHDGAWKIDRIL